MRTPIRPRAVETAARTRNLSGMQNPDRDTPATSPQVISATPLPLDPTLPRASGYEILAVVGCGGMGVVYEARHRALNRRVAIKALRGEALADPATRERFRAEAEAIARLQHPNIIQVFEVGTLEPIAGETYSGPFIALEFVDGGDLTQRVRGPQPAREAAWMVERLARAAHAAHGTGVVHRDLKPSNVLLTRVGEPKIADFGIAKQFGSAERSAVRHLTLDGVVVGTPEYMAPEQFDETPVTPAIDVYALGVILYELLTGRVPFKGATFADTMVMAMRQEPVPPSRLRPGLPRDLETICLKCLEKSPSKRYESAEALADDLTRWAEGRPIRARAVGTAERTLRWARRNPAIAVLSVAVLLVAVAGLAGILWQWDDARANAARAVVSARLAEESAAEAREAARKERWERYRISAFAASSSLRLADTNAARRSLDAAPEEHRDWAWKFMNARLDQAREVLPTSGFDLSHAWFDPNGRNAITRDTRGEVRVWDTIAGKEYNQNSVWGVVWRPLLSNDGAVLAQVPGDHSIILRDVATGRIRSRLTGHAAGPVPLMFSPDDNQLFTTADDQTVRAWDTATGTVRHIYQTPKGTGQAMAISPDGRLAVSGEDELRTIRLWELQTGRTLALLKGHRTLTAFVKFSPTGDRLITAELFPENAIRLWEVPSGKLIRTMRGHVDELYSINFSPDGTRLVSASSDRTIRIWDASNKPTESTRSLLSLEGHTGRVRCAVFSPDGQHVASASEDGTVRYWDATTGKSIAVLLGHTQQVVNVSFRTEEPAIVSASIDGTLRIWDLREAESDRAICGHKSFVYSVAFHPDGTRVASSAWDGTARVWNATTGEQLLSIDHGKDAFGSPTIVSSVAFHPRGHMLATLARDDGLRLWDSETGLLLHRWKVPSGDWRDSRVRFSPRGDLVATGGKDGTVHVWDVSTREEVVVFAGHNAPVRDVAFSPDGRRVASAGEFGDFTVRVWDIPTRKPVWTSKLLPTAVYSVTWSPDGKLVASGSNDGHVRLWDAAAGETVGLLQHGTNVYDLAFADGGKRLVTACSDNLIRVWDVETRQPVAELSGHKAYVHALSFSPDGTRLASASGDTTVRVWDSLTRTQRTRR